MKNKMIYRTDRKVIFHGIDDGNLTVWRSTEGNCYIVIGLENGNDSVIYPIHIDGSHYNIDQDMDGAWRKLESGRVHPGPRSRDILPSTVSWRDYENRPDTAESIAKMDNLIKAQSDKIKVIEAQIETINKSIIGLQTFFSKYAKEDRGFPPPKTIETESDTE